MAIEKIRVSNFKSFKDLEIELGQFNVLIGANASGKSNFVQIFRFLRDIAQEGLSNAISLQGGVAYLRDTMLGSSVPLSFEIAASGDFEDISPIVSEEEISGLVEAIGHKMVYRFALKFRERGEKFEVAEDTLRFLVESVKFLSYPGKEEQVLGAGELVTSNVKGRVSSYFSLGGGPLDRMPSPELKINLPQRALLLENPAFLAGSFLTEMFGSYRTLIYDFDPKLSKENAPFAGRRELEGNGSNLAIVLKNLLENKENKRALTNLLKDSLPFVDDLTVERFLDKWLLFKLRETYTQEYLPAFLLSDGTINLIALIVALYFEEKPFIIIEEPERNIHPYLISKVVEMMKDAAERQKKQIIITTHSPEIVKYAGIEDLLLISRDKEGFSTITRPKDKERVKTFLEHDLGVDDLYALNLLEV